MRNAEGVTNQDSDFTVITLRGEADAFVAPRIRSDLATALGNESPLVIDLSQATFIDSTIVGILLEGLAESEKLERRVIDARPPRVEYRLTDEGRRLKLVVDAVSSFAAPR